MDHKEKRIDWRTRGECWTWFLTHGTYSKRTNQKPIKLLKKIYHLKEGFKKGMCLGKGFDKYLKKKSWAHNLAGKEIKLQNHMPIWLRTTRNVEKHPRDLTEKTGKNLQGSSSRQQKW